MIVAAVPIATAKRHVHLALLERQGATLSRGGSIQARLIQRPVEDHDARGQVQRIQLVTGPADHGGRVQHPEPVSTVGVPVMPTLGRMLPHGSELAATGSATCVCHTVVPLAASMA